MTVIIGLVSDGIVTIGADSAGSDGTIVTRRSDPKVFRRGPYLIGFASSFRMGELLQFSGNLPDPPEDPADLYRFMVCDFIQSVRSLLKDGGYIKTENGQEVAGEFMVGVHGRLFVMDEDFQVGEHVDGTAAIGAGYQVALGALTAQRLRPTDPHNDVHMALHIAEYYCANVDGPFIIMSTDRV